MHCAIISWGWGVTSLYKRACSPPPVKPPSPLGCNKCNKRSLTCWVRLHTLLRVVAQSLKPVNLLATWKRTQLCYPTTPNIVESCCVRLQLAETGQTFEPTTPNISFVLWSPKRSATMLDLFARFLQHCWGHERPLCMVSLEFTNVF